MFGDDLFASFFGFALVLPLAFLALVALAIVAVATGHAEPDPEGRRAYGLYLAAVGFVAVLTVLFAATAAVGSVIDALVEEDEYAGVEEFSEEDFFFDEGVDSGFALESDADDQAYADAVRGGLIALAGLAVYVLHRRRIDAVEEESMGREGPAWRVHHGYLLALAFLGVIVALVSASDALYGVFRSVAPGITGSLGDDSAERRAGLAQLLRSGVLATAGVFVFQFHWRRSQRIATPPPPTPAVVPPTPPGGEDPEPASPPS